MARTKSTARKSGRFGNDRFLYLFDVFLKVLAKEGKELVVHLATATIMAGAKFLQAIDFVTVVKGGDASLSKTRLL